MHGERIKIKKSTVYIETSSYKNSSPCEVTVRLHQQLLQAATLKGGEAGLSCPFSVLPFRSAICCVLFILCGGTWSLGTQ
jgi:hypothetical protein